ncbi:MAG TPA: hypothetical protein VK982_06605, partial [Bacteroidales bacterium]|nr:hypothetical protein [Bacteroidales bacterium]
KDEKNRKIQGKVYGMSEELRTINVYTGILDNSLSDLLIQAKDLNLISTFNNEYFSVIFFNPEFYSTMLYLNLMQIQTSYYYELYLNLYESQIDDKKIIPREIEKLKKGVKQLTLYPLSDITKKQNTYNYIKS